MNPTSKNIVVTGGAHGIGRGLCERFAKENAANIVVVDIDQEGAEKVANDVGGLAYAVDVGDNDSVAQALNEIQQKIGPIDLYCSNAGVGYPDGEHVAAADDALWDKSWRINMMAHVYASRVLLPQMLERGEGYFLITASAAGLLSQIGSATYSVTKHAAVGFAESLAIAHGDKGIGVSLLCPQGVDTRMMAAVAGGGPQGADGIISIEDCANATMEGLANNDFLILPHAEVSTYMKHKVGDYERWITGMQRLRDKFPT